MRGEKDENKIYEIRSDINVGDMAEDGSQFRPHIVWFEEPVTLITEAMRIMSKADIFILIGTSLQVYPAAGLIDYVPQHVPKFIIDKKIPYASAHDNFFFIEKPATEGVDELKKILLG
jgi:NAD-dependent deacetylase